MRKTMCLFLSSILLLAPIIGASASGDIADDSFYNAQINIESTEEVASFENDLMLQNGGEVHLEHAEESDCSICKDIKQNPTRDICSKCQAPWYNGYCSYHTWGYGESLMYSGSHSYGLLGDKTCHVQYYTASRYDMCSGCGDKRLVATGGALCHEYHTSCGRGEYACCSVGWM